MERYTEKPRTQGERRTDNTPAPIKTQQGQKDAGVMQFLPLMPTC